MNDDLERRLRQVGTTPTPPLSPRAVQAIEDRLLTEPTSHRRPAWVPLVAAAAAVVLLVGVAWALRRPGRDTLQPATTLAEVTTTTRDALSPSTSGAPTTEVSATITTLTPSTSVPTQSLVPESTTNGSSPPATTDPTAPETTLGSSATTPRTTAPSPTSTVAPQQLPEPSFLLRTQRIGDRVVFRWPQFEGVGGVRYMLIRVGSAGLTEWPVTQGRIALIIPDITATNGQLDLPLRESRRWVLVVVGENRQLLAVSETAVTI